MATKPTHDCPLCKGLGKVSKKIAESKVSVRDRKLYNATMRVLNNKYRKAGNGASVK